ncbi:MULTISPECIES: hypothetical protein [Actinomycetes]|uniref:hypothetical protein n=1 Tax=Actinomycetes TaxID=1760 RepID=UPI000302B6ED|nr:MULTISPECIES: hypothetical protein [Actinomycetes]
MPRYTLPGGSTVDCPDDIGRALGGTPSAESTEDAETGEQTEAPPKRATRTRSKPKEE